MTLSWQTTDVLILGSGLAGLRAAWAAREAAPNLTVTVAGLGTGPSGSSFANRNDALGMQAPDDSQADAFVSKALTLARPGTADEGLVRILAQDAQARLRDLESLDLSFRREESGRLALFPGCFSRAPRAVIFTDLGRAFAQFRARVAALGTAFLTGVEALGLLARDGAVAGALFLQGDGGFLAVRSRAVVLALGGPAALFGLDLSGPGSTGLSYGLLAEAGAELANAGFLQFLWAEVRTRSFCSPAEALADGCVLLCPDGQRLALDADAPESIRDVLPELRTARATHCPAGYGLADAALDELLLANLWPDGLARVERAGVLLELGLFAHAGNGGAQIDADGRTSAAGLFACGECATGMHGANRLGGGMVLATQVFGARAGRAAAKLAAEVPLPGPCPAIPGELLERARDPEAACSALERIRQGMQRHCLFGPRQGIEAWRAELADLAETGPGRRARLAAKAGFVVANGPAGADQA